MIHMGMNHAKAGGKCIQRKSHLNSTLKKEYKCGGEVQLSGIEVTIAKTHFQGGKMAWDCLKNKVWDGEEIQAWGRDGEA